MFRADYLQRLPDRFGITGRSFDAGHQRGRPTDDARGHLRGGACPNWAPQASAPTWYPFRSEQHSYTPSIVGNRSKPGSGL